MLSENASLPSRGKKQPMIKKKKRIVPIIFLIFSLIILATVGYIYLKYEKLLDQVSADSDIEVPALELAKIKPLTILLLGLDSRENTGNLNTDVIMVATLNPERKTAVVVSIPRDTYLKVEGYQARKANSFYSVVSRLERESSGLSNKLIANDEIKKIFGQFLSIRIDYVMIVNFLGFEEIIDQLSGIDMDVKIDMRYVDPTDGTDINLKKGFQTLDGKNALDFVRYRMSNRGTASTSDMQRNERQQQVIAAIVDKIGFSTVFKIDGIFNSIGNNLKSDIPKNQLNSLISTYVKISNDHIEYVSLDGEWRSPFVYLIEHGFEEAKKRLQQELE